MRPPACSRRQLTSTNSARSPEAARAACPPVRSSFRIDAITCCDGQVSISIVPGLRSSVVMVTSFLAAGNTLDRGLRNVVAATAAVFATLEVAAPAHTAGSSYLLRPCDHRAKLGGGTSPTSAIDLISMLVSSARTEAYSGSV